MLERILWYFFCYAFLGWVLETAAAAVRSRRFENRGILDGPLCAVYGIAGAVLSLGLPELRGNWLFLFLGSAICATVLEWIAGHLLERAGYGKWWDYSRLPFNLDGYICLSYSALWGLLGAVCVQWGSPFLLGLLQLMSGRVRAAVLGILVCLTVVDGAGSLIALYGRPGSWPRVERADSWITRATLRLQDWIGRMVRKRLARYHRTPLERAVREKQAVFAQGACFYKIFLLFFIGAFLGDVTETIFCLLKYGVLMSRSSVVWGPFSLVWGIAMGGATALLYKYKDKPDRFLFIAGVLLGGAYEYLCSVFTEVCFGTVFWDYSQIPFNLGGRINLLYCFFWGIAAVVWMKWLYPFFSVRIERLPVRAGRIVTWVLVVFMALNMAVSSMALLRYSERSRGIPARSGWQEYMDSHYGDEVMKGIYPNAVKT